MIVILLVVIALILWGIYRAHVPSLKNRVRQAMQDYEHMKMQNPGLFKDDKKKKSIWDKDISELFEKKKKRRKVVTKRDEKGKFIKS